MTENACAKCRDCFHPHFGTDSDGQPCDWCQDCGCAKADHEAPDSTPTERDPVPDAHAILAHHYGLSRAEVATRLSPTQREAGCDCDYWHSEHRWHCATRRPAPDSTPTEREAGDVGEVAAVEWIKRLVGAWDCCATCAGGVLAQRDRERERAAGARVLREAARAAAASPATRAGDLYPGGVWAKWLNDLADALEDPGA